MYGIAEQVREWLAEGRDVLVAQVVATRGFSSRDPAAAAASSGAGPVGSVLEGIDPAAALRLGPGLHEITIGEAEALSAGLSCGGTASVLVRAAADLGPGVWAALVAREPVCLVTDVASGRTDSYSPQTIREAPGEIPRLFGRGVSATSLADGLAVVALWPVTTLVVVGDGLIAQALVDQGALLGWTSLVTAGVDDAVAAAGALHASDAMVVLSHSRDVDGPALSAALAGPAGYVGALGSRRTQAARAEWLTAHGVAEEDRQRIHGPAGLDIDAHTPAEIAVSIVAEILGNRAGSSGGALRERPGPVHVAGVNAPPPRY